MHLIGINGFKTSGKDSVFTAIKRLHEKDGPWDEGDRVERRAFADSLKIMAAKALGYEGDDDTLIDTMNRFKEDGLITAQFNQLGGNGPDDTVLGGWVRSISGREYLQNFGSKAREVFGDTFWVDQVVPEDTDRFDAVWQTAGRNGTDTGILPYIGCVTDVRYENEAERVLDQGGIVLEVIRPGIISDGHDSERPLPPEYVTYRIVNDGSLTDLDSKVADFLGNL